MTDSEPPPPSAEPKLDPVAEERRLQEIGEQIQRAADQAADDLEIGGQGRTFADSGVRAQVEEEGDTSHPPADR